MPNRIAPKKAQRLYQEALNRDVYLSFRLPEEVADPFDLPEFYDDGEVAVISKGPERLSVWRLGNPSLIRGSNLIHKGERFREEFPSGLIPDEDDVLWDGNAWFEVFEGDPTTEGEIFLSLDAAIVWACETVLIATLENTR